MLKNEIDNHFEALLPKGGYNINKNKLEGIKEKFCKVKHDSTNKKKEIEKCEVKVISGKTGKLVQSRKGESTWNLFTPLSRRNNTSGSFKYYVVDKLNKDLKDKVEYNKITKTIPLSEIIDAFSKDNIVNNGINNIIDNCKNIIINKVNNTFI